MEYRYTKVEPWGPRKSKKRISISSYKSTFNRP
jgi:hypothetical protein